MVRYLIVCLLSILFASSPIGTAMITLTASPNGCTRNRANYPSACVMRTDECVNGSSQFWDGVNDSYPSGSFTSFAALDSTRISFRYCTDSLCSVGCRNFTTQPMADYLNITKDYMLYQHELRCVDLGPYMVYVATCGNEEWCDLETPQSCQTAVCLEQFCIASYRSNTCLANADCTGSPPLIEEQQEQSSSSAGKDWKATLMIICGLIGFCSVLLGATWLFCSNAAKEHIPKDNTKIVV